MLAGGTVHGIRFLRGVIPISQWGKTAPCLLKVPLVLPQDHLVKHRMYPMMTSHRGHCVDGEEGRDKVSDGRHQSSTDDMQLASVSHQHTAPSSCCC